MVAPPEARLNTFNGARISLRGVNVLPLYLGVGHVVCVAYDTLSMWSA